MSETGGKKEFMEMYAKLAGDYGLQDWEANAEAAYRRVYKGILGEGNIVTVKINQELLDSLTPEEDRMVHAMLVVGPIQEVLDKAEQVVKKLIEDRCKAEHERIMGEYLLRVGWSTLTTCGEN